MFRAMQGIVEQLAADFLSTRQALSFTWRSAALHGNSGILAKHDQFSKCIGASVPITKLCPIADLKLKINS